MHSGTGVQCFLRQMSDISSAVIIHIFWTAPCCYTLYWTLFDICTTLILWNSYWKTKFCSTSVYQKCEFKKLNVKKKNPTHTTLSKKRRFFCLADFYVWSSLFLKKLQINTLWSLPIQSRVMSIPKSAK